MGSGHVIRVTRVKMELSVDRSEMGNESYAIFPITNPEIRWLSSRVNSKQRAEEQLIFVD